MKKIFQVALIACLAALPMAAMAEDAEDAEVLKMAKEHYARGLEAYKTGKYDIAIKELKKAYLLKRLPALLINIGATYRKMGDPDQALHFYKKYLEEAPAEAKDRKDVEGIIAEIDREKNKPAAKETPAMAPTPTPAPAPAAPAAEPAQKWSHTPVDAAPPATPIDVRVNMPVMKGVKVFVYYRQPGEADFKPVLMKRQGSEKIGRIPADATNGTSVQYYIEARDTAGTVVQSSGSQANPNIVMVDPTAKPQLASVDGHQGAEEAAGEAGSKSASNADLDDESAPVIGEIKGKGKKGRKTHGAAAVSSGPRGKLFWAGVGTLIGGAGMVGLGGYGLYRASSISDRWNNFKANDFIDNGGNIIYYNNDPNASVNEADLGSQASMWNSLGIAFTVLGTAAVLGGAGMMVADWMLHRRGAEQPKAPPKPRPSEDASIKQWYLSPTANPKQVGIGGGFTF